MPRQNHIFRVHHILGDLGDVAELAAAALADGHLADSRAHRGRALPLLGVGHLYIVVQHLLHGGGHIIGGALRALDLGAACVVADGVGVPLIAQRTRPQGRDGEGEIVTRLQRHLRRQVRRNRRLRRALHRQHAHGKQ